MTNSPTRTPRCGYVLAAVATLFSIPSIAISAENYPNRAITIVVPFSAGAGTDLVARAIGEKLGAKLKTSVVVENRPGAAGVIGTSYVAQATPDGYTILFTPNSFSFAHIATGSAKPLYDPVDQFTPVVEVAKTPVVLVAGPHMDVKSFQDALTAAKSNQPSYGSAGNGSITHLIGEAVNRATNMGNTHIPYKGTAQAIADLLGGHIDYAYASLSAVEPHLASNKLKVLAVTSKERTSLAPEIPTVAELGFPDIDLGAWYGIFAPKGTSDDVVNMLNKNINEILEMPDMQNTLKKQGSTAVGGASSVLDATNKSDAKALQTLFKQLNLSAN